MPRTQVKSIITDIKRLLELFGAQMLMAESTPRGLDTHWKQAPVTLEDALGNLIPIPLELVNSWDVGLHQNNLPEAAAHRSITDV